MNRSRAHEIRRLIGQGKTLAQIAKASGVTTWDLCREIRNYLTVDRLHQLSANKSSPQDIADTYGVSLSLIYKHIRHLRVQHLFFDQLMACRDVCPIIIRLMAMTGATVNEIRRAAYPHIRYGRLRRFVDREGMAHYFEGEPLLPRVQWAERCPPLFHIEDIARRVMRNDSPKDYQTTEQYAPALRTVYKRLGARSWKEARKLAATILGDIS